MGSRKRGEGGGEVPRERAVSEEQDELITEELFPTWMSSIADSKIQHQAINIFRENQKKIGLLRALADLRTDRAPAGDVELLQETFWKGAAADVRLPAIKYIEDIELGDKVLEDIKHRHVVKRKQVKIPRAITGELENPAAQRLTEERPVAEPSGAATVFKRPNLARDRGVREMPDKVGETLAEQLRGHVLELEEIQTELAKLEDDVRKGAEVSQKIIEHFLDASLKRIREIIQWRSGHAKEIEEAGDVAQAMNAEFASLYGVVTKKLQAAYAKLLSPRR